MFICRELCTKSDFKIGSGKILVLIRYFPIGVRVRVRLLIFKRFRFVLSTCQSLIKPTVQLFSTILYLHVTTRFAFLLMASPKEFEAVHQYVPESESRLPWDASKNNSEPSGSRALRTLPVASTGRPSRYHRTSGLGSPSDLQLSVAGSCSNTVMSVGCSTIRGALPQHTSVTERFAC